MGGITRPCAISRGALEALTGASFIAPRDLLTRFATQQTRIEDLARSLFAIRPESITGTLNIWTDDVDDSPDAPARAQHAERRLA